MSSSKEKLILGVLLAFVVCGVNIHFIFQASTFLNFEIEKCPFCYNQTFCDVMHDLRIRMTLLEYILGCINKKYVFFGVFESKSVAIKRLAYRHEADDLDARIAALRDEKHFDFHLSNSRFYAKSIAMLNQSFTSPNYKLRLCPTLINADILFEPIVKKDPHNKFLFINVWTTLQLNPEPLILQIFRKDENWPVPEFVGSCGRIALVENSGKTIQNYLSHPWLFRVHILEQLLWMAHNFTFSSSNFGVYLRDISPDNIVVDSNMKTRIVDLEHVVIVDKNPPKEDQPSTWQTEHRSEHFFCDKCLVYSPMEICEHHISDHNFYAVCKEFLNSIYPRDLGLLHSAPSVDYVNSNLGKLKYYTEECIQPSRNVSRFEIANEFREFLHELKAAVFEYQIGENMVVENDSVLKKVSPNGKLTVYLRCREYASFEEPVDGGVVIEPQYLKHRKVFGQLVAHFRFGREKDEVMGLKFYKDFILASQQIYPPVQQATLTNTQIAIQNKVNERVGEVYPFVFFFPAAAPVSVSLLSKNDTEPEKICGIHYFVKIFVGTEEHDYPHRRSSVKLNILRIRYAPISMIENPPHAVKKQDFVICYGNVELEATLDKTIFQLNERIPVNVSIQNYSNKTVRKIRVTLLQNVRIQMLQNGQYKRVIDEYVSEKGCPVAPGSSMQTIIPVVPMLMGKRMKDGVALNGYCKKGEINLASSTFLHSKPVKDAFGIIVNYFIRVKLDLGALNGQLCVVLPVILMPQQPNEDTSVTSEV